METKLSKIEIMDKIFAITEESILKQISRIYKGSEYKSTTIHLLVSNLIEHFNKEKSDLMNLCKILNDIPSGMLSFKVTEAKLYTWKDRISTKTGFFAPSWWGDDVILNLKEVQKTLNSEKNIFLEKWRD